MCMCWLDSLDLTGRERYGGAGLTLDHSRIAMPATLRLGKKVAIITGGASYVLSAPSHPSPCR